MKQVTVRMSDENYDLLRTRATLNHRSLSGEICSMIGPIVDETELGVGVEGKHPEVLRAEKMLRGV